VAEEIDSEDANGNIDGPGALSLVKVPAKPSRTMALWRLATVLLALALVAQAAVVSVHNPTSYTIVNGTAVKNALRVITLSCLSGSTLQLNAIDRSSGGTLNINIACTGTTHKWDIYPVEQVPLETAIYVVESRVVSEYLTELRPDAIAERVRAVQRLNGANQLVYIPNNLGPQSRSTGRADGRHARGLKYRIVLNDYYVPPQDELNSLFRLVTKSAGPPLILDCTKIAQLERYGLEGTAAAKGRMSEQQAVAWSLCMAVNQAVSMNTDKAWSSGRDSKGEAAAKGAAAAGYNECDKFVAGTDITNLHACTVEIINIQISFQAALERTLEALKSTNARIDNLADQLENLYGRQLVDENLMNNLIIDYKVMLKGVQQMAAAGVTQAALTASSEANLLKAQQVSQANDIALNERTQQIGADLQATKILEVQLIQDTARTITAETDLKLAIVANQMILGDAAVLKRQREMEFTMNLRLAELQQLYDGKMVALYEGINTLQGVVRRNYQYSVTLGDTLSQLTRMNIFQGQLATDFHRALQLVDDRGHTPVLQNRGTPPIDLRNNYTLIGMRSTQFEVPMVYNSETPDELPIACPMVLANNTLIKSVMDDIYMNTVVPAIRVPRDIDKKYLRYGDDVVMAVRDTELPDLPENWRYVSATPAVCAASLCGACTQDDSVVKACATTNPSFAIRFAMTRDPESSDDDPYVRGLATIALDASSSSAYYGSALAIANTTQCLSDVTTYGYSNVTRFKVLRTTLDKRNDAPLQWEDPIALRVVGNGNGYVGAGPSSACLRGNSSSATAWAVRFIKAYAWTTTPLGRSPVSRWNVQGQLRAPALPVFPPPADRRIVHARAKAERAPLNFCPAIAETLQAISLLNATNALACIANTSCLYVVENLQRFALFADISGLNDGSSGVNSNYPTTSGLKPYFLPVSTNAASDPVARVGSVVVMGAGSTTITTTAWNQTGVFSPAAPLMSATTAAPFAFGTPFQWIRGNVGMPRCLSPVTQNKCVVCETLNLNPPINPSRHNVLAKRAYILVGVPIRTRVTIHIDPDSTRLIANDTVTGIRDWKTPTEGFFRFVSDGVSDISYYVFQMPGPIIFAQCNRNGGTVCSGAVSVNTATTTTGCTGVIGTVTGSNLYQWVQMPGKVTVTVEPDPEAVGLYRAKCVPNGPSGSGTVLSENCNSPLSIPYEYCTGESCGQPSTKYYQASDLGSTFLSGSETYSGFSLENSLNPTLNYLSAAAWGRGVYTVTIKGGASNLIPTLARPTSIQLAATVLTGVNLFANTTTPAINSMLGISPLSGTYESCRAACHLQVDAVRCATNQPGLCSWRYSATLNKNFCVPYNIDLRTVCTPLDVATCALGYYGRMCAWNGTACAMRSTIDVSSTPFLSECTFTANVPTPSVWISKPTDPYLATQDVSGGAAWFPFLTSRVGVALGPPLTTNETSKNDFRMCIWNRNPAKLVDLNVGQFNRLDQFVPCWLRFAGGTGGESDCLWTHRFPAIDVTTIGATSVTARKVPYCVFSSTSTSASCTEYVQENYLSTGWEGSNGTYQPYANSVCWNNGVYCNFEKTNEFPETPTPRYQWYLKNSGGRADPTCSTYNSVLQDCVVKSLRTSMTPVERCEVWGGRCVGTCARYNGDMRGCVTASDDGAGGKCYYTKTTEVCANNPGNIGRLDACALVKGNCVAASSWCNMYYTNNTGCAGDDRCTWIQFNETLTTTPSYCELSREVSYPECIDEFGAKLRTCDVGNGIPGSLTLAQIENSCTPYSLLQSGGLLSKDACMQTNDADGVACVYLESTGRVAQLSQCFSQNDPQFIEYAARFNNTLGTKVTTRPEYLVEVDFPFTDYEGVNFQYIVDDVLLEGLTLDISNPKEALGITIVPEDVKEFFPCPVGDYGSVVNANGICCSQAEFDGGGLCTGPSRTMNPQHPDQLFKLGFLANCLNVTSSNPNTYVEMTNITFNIYNIIRQLPAELDDGYMAAFSTCPVLLADENNTQSTVAVGTASVYAYIERSIAARLNISPRTASAECLIDYQIGNEVLKLQRLSDTTLRSLTTYYRYTLYGTPFYVSEFPSEVYGNYNGRLQDIGPINIADTFFPALRQIILRDQQATVNTLSTKYGPYPPAWFATVGRGTEVYQLGGTQSSTDIESLRWVAKFGSHSKEFAPIYELNSYSKNCDATAEVYNTNTTSTLMLEPTACVVTNDYAQLLPPNYYKLMHTEHNGRIYVVPDRHIDISSAFEARNGKIGCYPAGGPTKTSVTYDEAIRRNPTMTTECLTGNPKIHSSSRNPGIPDWRFDWCGSIFGKFSLSTEIDFALGLSMLKSRQLVNINGTLLSDVWNATLAEDPSLIPLMLNMVREMQAYWAASGCPRTLVNHVMPDRLFLYEAAFNETENVTRWGALDVFYEALAMYRLDMQEEGEAFSYDSFMDMMLTTLLRPSIDGGANWYCGNCGPGYTTECAESWAAWPIASTMGTRNELCALSQVLNLYHGDEQLIGRSISNADELLVVFEVPGDIDIVQVTVDECPNPVDGTVYFVAPTTELRLATLTFFNPAPQANMLLRLSVVGGNCPDTKLISLAPLEASSQSIAVCNGNFSIRLTSESGALVCFNSGPVYINETVVSEILTSQAGATYITSLIRDDLLVNFERYAGTALLSIQTSINASLIQYSVPRLLEPVNFRVSEVSSNLTAFASRLLGDSGGDFELPYTLPVFFTNYSATLQQQDFDRTRMEAAIAEQVSAYQSVSTLTEQLYESIENATIAAEAARNALTLELDGLRLDQANISGITDNIILTLEEILDNLIGDAMIPWVENTLTAAYIIGVVLVILNLGLSIYLFWYTKKNTKPFIDTFRKKAAQIMAARKGGPAMPPPYAEPIEDGKLPPADPPATLPVPMQMQTDGPMYGYNPNADVAPMMPMAAQYGAGLSAPMTTPMTFAAPTAGAAAPTQVLHPSKPAPFVPPMSLSASSSLSPGAFSASADVLPYTRTARPGSARSVAQTTYDEDTSL
jgi:hypothetical protein